MNNRWKLLLAAAACIAVVAWCGWRAYVAFRGAPPGWIERVDRESRSLARDDALRSAWKDFSELLAATRRTAEQRRLPLGSVSLLALEPNVSNGVFFVTETIINQGFNPQKNVQTSLGGNPDGPIGYYTAACDPIPFTIVRVTGNPRFRPVTLHLAEAIAPGTSQVVVRVETRHTPTKTGKDGKVQAGLGRFPRAPNAVYARAVRLPAGSVVARATPEKTATILTGTQSLVTWIGTAADANTPLNVAFVPPKAR